MRGRGRVVVQKRGFPVSVNINQLSERELELEMPQVFVTRRETFSAAHRLHCNQLSEEENRELYGPCNNLHGHGHNYSIEVIITLTSKNFTPSDVFR